ncbi:glycosyltransferase family 2 protein [bacterium]|nr:MAG: glycosyltransferase family 2 protein [bacterium]
MPAPHPEVSILIVSYNTRGLLRGCLESLRRGLDEVKLEIIVVDNASTDSSSKMIHDEFPAVKLVQSADNIGFASGINLARKSASGEFLLILNPDCLVPRFTIQKLRDFLVEHPKRAIAGAHITTADGHDLPSVFTIPTLFREFWNFLPELKSRILHWLPFHPGGEVRESCQVESISGAAFMIRAAHFDQVGGMDGNFFLYHEELDLCARIKQAGLEVWSLPDAQVIHFDAQASGYSTRSLPVNPVLEWRVLGMDRLWQKHRSPADHRKWRRQARSLLGFRVLLLSLKRMWVHPGIRRCIDHRIRDLKELRSKLSGLA